MFNIFGKKEEKTTETTSETTSEIKAVECSHDNCTCEHGNENIDVVIKPTEPQQQEKVEIPPLTFKEMKSLKKARYQENIMNNAMFKNAYLLLNKKTGQMAEIRAASSCHACNIIGWKLNQVKLISARDVSSETHSSSNS